MIAVWLLQRTSMDRQTEHDDWDVEQLAPFVQAAGKESSTAGEAPRGEQAMPAQSEVDESQAAPAPQQRITAPPEGAQSDTTGQQAGVTLHEALFQGPEGVNASLTAEQEALPPEITFAPEEKEAPAQQQHGLTGSAVEITSPARGIHQQSVRVRMCYLQQRHLCWEHMVQCIAWLLATHPGCLAPLLTATSACTRSRAGGSGG